MAFNGNGQFIRLYSWVNDAINGLKISSTRMDAEMDGMATGLSACITKDGQTTPTANLPMGSFIHTGVGSASARTQYASAAQVQDGGLTYGAGGSGTGDVITFNTTLVFAAYTAGQTFSFIALAANTGPVTVNINSLGAKAVTKNGSAALVANDIPAAGALVLIEYDGTQFQLMRPATLSGFTGVIPANQGGTGIANNAASTLTISGSFATTFTIAGITSLTLPTSGTVATTASNVATATALQNARTIGGVSFDGTANIVPQTIQSVNEAADTTCFPLFISASGSQSLQPLNNTAFTFNASTGALGATSFSGAGTGLTGTAASLTVGASTILATTRTIGGVSFNGSANIVPQTIQSINEASDSTCFPLFISASGSQSLQPLNNTSFTFNSNIFQLGVGSLNVTSSGAIPSEGIYLAVANNLALSARSLQVANFTNPASAVNYLSFSGSATGVPLAILAAGTDTNISWQLSSKGNSPITFYSNSNTNPLLQLIHAATAVNYGTVTAAATGGGVTFGAAGSDTNVDLILAPQGTSPTASLVRFNGGSTVANGSVAKSFTAVGPTGSATTVQEWLAIKNSSGTVRYIPCF